jgi:hypothetical protein
MVSEVTASVAGCIRASRNLLIVTSTISTYTTLHTTCPSHDPILQIATGFACYSFSSSGSNAARPVFARHHRARRVETSAGNSATTSVHDRNSNQTTAYFRSCRHACPNRYPLSCEDSHHPERCISLLASSLLRLDRGLPRSIHLFPASPNPPLYTRRGRQPISISQASSLSSSHVNLRPQSRSWRSSIHRRDKRHT